MLTAAISHPPCVPKRCHHGERSTNFHPGAAVHSKCQDYPKCELALLAWETVLPTMVLKVEKGGAAVECNAAWLDSLPEKDFKRIKTAVDGLVGDGEEKKPEDH